MLRGMSIGFVVLSVLAMLWFLLIVSNTVIGESVLVIAFGGTSLFAVAAAVTLFSVENEEGTTELLQTLPRNPQALLLGKLMAAVLMTVVTLVALLVAAHLIASEHWHVAGPNGDLLTQGSIFIFEALTWGLLASLLCRNPLLAAVLGIAGASLSSQIAMVLTVENSTGFTADDFRNAIPGRFALVAIVAAIDAWLGLRWLGRQTATKPRLRAPAAAIAGFMPKPNLKLGAFGRLVWQSVRQSWKAAVACLFVGVLLTASYQLILMSLTGHQLLRSLLMPLGFLWTPALLGAMVFRADQRQQQYRFLSEHAARPKTLWLARQVTWLVPMVATGALLTILIGLYAGYSSAGHFSHHHLYRTTNVNNMNMAMLAGLQVLTATDYAQFLLQLKLAWLSAFAAFAFGQFFSLTLRSNILAGMCSLFVATILSVWCVVVWAWQLSPLWFVAPLGIGAMLASLLRVRNWMFERTSIVRWLLPIAALAMPIAFVILMTPSTRLAQVNPTYDAANLRQQAMSFSPFVTIAEAEQKAGQDVADAYTRISSSLQGGGLTAGERNALLDEFIELTHTKCRLPIEFSPGYGRGATIDRITDELLSQADLIPGVTVPREALKEEAATIHEKQLRALLAKLRVGTQQERGYFVGGMRHVTPVGDMLVEWATSENQTSELLKQAITQIKVINSTRRPPSGKSMSGYLRARYVIRGDSPPSFTQVKRSYPQTAEWIAYSMNQLPGERARAERALEITVTATVDYLIGIEQQFMQSMTNSYGISADTFESVYGPYGGFNRTLVAANARSMANRHNGYHDVFHPQILSHNARLLVHAQTSYFVDTEYHPEFWIHQSMQEWINEIVYQRAELVRLALIAYRLDNGDYPDQLAQLAPSYLAAHEYQNPYNSRPFGYHPTGFETRFWAESYYGKLQAEAKTPLIWCVGQKVLTPVKQTVAFKYNIHGDRERVETADLDEIAENAELKAEGVTTFDAKGNYWGSDAFLLPLPK